MIRFVFLILLSFSFLQASDKKILIISSNGAKSSQSAKLEFVKKEAKKLDLNLDYKFVSQIKNKQEILSKYDLVLFDALTGAKKIKKTVEIFGSSIAKLNNKILPLIKDNNPYVKNITTEQRDILCNYWENGGIKNIQNMFKYIKYKVFDTKIVFINKPEILPMNGIYHPKNKNLAFNTTQEYFDFLGVDIDTNKKPVIAIYFGRNSIVGNILEPINEAIKLIESKGGIALPFYFKNPNKNDAIGLKFLQPNGKNIANTLLYFFSYVRDNGDKKRDFLKLNIPILHAIYYRGGDQKKWEQDKIGMPFGTIASGYVIPESLGFTDSFVIATQNKITKEFQVIPYQMESFINKALNVASLQTIENENKKVVLMYYALGRDKIGASFLNIPKSIESIFKGFKENGYKVEDVNASYIQTQALKTTKVLYDVNLYNNAKEMLKDGQADLYPYSEYMKEFYKLPVDVRTDMIRAWGYPLKSKMLIYQNDKWYFLIPRVKIGNVLIMPQPHPLERDDSIRSMNLDVNKKDERDWHNPTQPVNHSYFATYLYVKNQFKADAIIHLGTHGTVEWTMGKQRGLSIYDSPLMCLSDMPHFYPYIVNNTAETIQIRRRARGVTISHQTPPFALTGSYLEINELMELNAQFKTVTQGLMRKQIKEEIIKKTIALNIHKDLGIDVKCLLEEEKEHQESGHEEHEHDDFDHFLHKLEKYIRSFTSVAQPLGMHTFGTVYEKDHLITTIVQMLGKEFLVKANGKDYAIKNYKDFNSSKAYNIVKEYCIENKKIQNNNKNLDNFHSFIEQGKEFYKLLTSQKENINLFRALDGKHIQGGTGGGPIRNPQSLPTGINLVSFDPSKVPTPSAYKTGKILIDDFIANYYKQNNKYPNKITFNLWGLETVRHHGVLESQLLGAIGVKPIRNHRGKIIDTKIIPFKELKRPRIDVVVSATGLYRDMYPNTIKLIANAVKKISELKEKNNYLLQNSLSLFKDLVKHKGIDKKEAQYLSTIRVFSSKTGNYGSGVDAIEQTSRWKDDKRITKDYLEHTGYYFGSNVKRWNEKNIDLNLYSKNLSGTNAVVFSRSSNLYGLLASDDPYAHFGSIGMAIRNIDGKTPKTYISNLRDPNDAKIQDTARFMSEELRGRYFHPNWLSQMKREDYSGTVEIASVFNNFWGWQVVNPNVVRSDQWDEFKSIYIDDKYNLKMQEWFKTHNPQALQDITEKMIEAYRKNYWETDEKNIKDLLELQEDLKKNYNTNTYNTKLKEFQEKAKIGFGISSLRQGQQPKLNINKMIKGQKLEKQQKQKIKVDYTSYYVFAFLLLVMLGGVIYERKKAYV